MSSKTKQKLRTSKEVASAPVNLVYGSPTVDFLTPCIYFYYLTHDHRPELNARAYFVIRDYNISDFKGEIGKLIEEADDGTIKPCGWALGDIRWRHVSYIVVVFKDGAHKLIEKNAVAFDPYHPFKGGTDYRELMSQGITAFYCENHLRDKGGDLLKDPSSPEYFKVVANHDGHGSGPFKRLNHNDSGTNMGPPIPPP